MQGAMGKNVSLSLQPKFVGLPLFGGVDNETDCNIEVSAFKMTFLSAKCVRTFERVCACLQDMQVRRSIGDGDEETDTMHHAVQEVNSTAVLHLNQAWYDAQHLQAMLIKKKTRRESNKAK